jgi:two-component system chemotaxis sensor kinase CheA
MDVVRQNLEQMQGLVQVETESDCGTRFILILPLTLATSHVLLVRSAGETIGVPMANIEHMLRIRIEEIGNLEGRPVIFAEGKPLPLISLARILDLKENEQPLLPDVKIPLVILTVLDKSIALRVDALLSTREIVIKSLGSQLRRVRNIAGATILGNGQVVTILNVADLMKSVHAGSTAPLAMPIIARGPRQRKLLVVDDSITTRTLEKHILENAGYHVSALVDGQEAWDFICRNEKELPDLVVSDIDMPRMDGFGLARAIKGDNRYTNIPVVLVTSLDSAQDRLQGMEAGADAYIVKGTFDQRELLEAIERLIK